MPRPALLDNLAGDTTHAAALSYLLQDFAPSVGLSVATGYVNLDGLLVLATRVQPERPTRLLLGALPSPGLGAGLPGASFDVQLAALAGERDFSRFPPSRAAERLRAVEHWLATADIEVRRYTTRFLHGKAYLFGSSADARAALVSSANLTGPGLFANLELGLVDYNPGPSGDAIDWFEGLWDQAAPFTDALRDLLFPAIGLVDAETVHLRALLELYGADVEPAAPVGLGAVDLVAFQRDGYERARRILERHGGVIYADGVGTGKTEIGLAFIEEYALRAGRLAIVVCPAQLKDNWQRRINQARLPAQVMSFNELAADEQLAPEAPNRRRHLDSDKDAYRLVVVDEAHALRNEGTTWYRAMERFLGGATKHAVLLTATPVNNGLWDLYNLILLFARHDRAMAAFGIESIRGLFIGAGANERDPENLDPDVLFPVADAVSVRRDRAFIQEHYPDAMFADGTPVRFPEPTLRTRRYDLDATDPGLFGDIISHIAALDMARYRPGAYLVEPDEDAAEAQLGGLLQSALLKRFESCWAACLATVGRMLAAHDAFLVAWEAGHVPSKAALREAARLEAGETGLGALVADLLERDAERRPVTDFRADYGDAVAADRARLEAIRARLAGLDGGRDPKLALLAQLLVESPAQKVAVFASFGETVAYLDEQLPDLVGGRRRVTVIGSQSTPDDRIRMIGRFCPQTVVRPDYIPPDGEVDLLLSTDVLSEGQNLQQAQAVVSYDMPWNPQRVVQRNGRVIRLRSPHETALLTTMLPTPGELEELLKLEATVRAKIRAAGVYGMEVEVIEGVSLELRSYAERLEAEDPTLLEEEGDEAHAGAFLGEQLRALLLRAAEEGEIRRLDALPWGIGAVFRQTLHGHSRGWPGMFFAVRTRPMEGAPEGHRYWRFVEWPTESDAGAVIASPLECLRRIDPQGGEPSDAAGMDVEAAWQRASEAIVAEHNARADPRAAQRAIGPAQRFALELLRDPSVILPEGAELAAEVLVVERSATVRRSLNEIRAELGGGRISANEAADRVVDVVRSAGLQPVTPEPLPEEIGIEDLGVVCWMAVLPGA